MRRYNQREPASGLLDLAADALMLSFADRYLLSRFSNQRKSEKLEIGAYLSSPCRSNSVMWASHIS